MAFAGARSFVERGLAFEVATMHRLATLGFHLRLCGQTGDGGIDLRGHWMLPQRDVPVIVQCKHSKHKASANLLREFEGVLSRLTDGTLGIFATHQGFSATVSKQLISSPYPIALCRFDNQNNLVHFMINNVVQSMLPQLIVGNTMVKEKDSLSSPSRRPQIFYIEDGAPQPVNSVELDN